MAAAATSASVCLHAREHDAHAYARERTREPKRTPPVVVVIVAAAAVIYIRARAVEFSSSPRSRVCRRLERDATTTLIARCV